MKKVKFLSEEWYERGHEDRERVRPDVESVCDDTIVNVTTVDDEGVKRYGHLRKGMLVLGLHDNPDVSIELSNELAFKVIILRDVAAAMMAFMSGKIKVDGHLMDLMSLNAASLSAETLEIMKKSVEYTCA